MTANKQCPECSELLKEKQNICACGWMRNSNSHQESHRCCYEYNGKRCKFPGTVSYGLRSNRWYCNAHFSARYDPDLSNAILEEMEKNFQEWVSPKSWRIKLLEENLKKYPKIHTKKRDIKKVIEELKKKILLD